VATTEVADFINEAHKCVGASGGSTFCAVQFGEATAYPHGVPEPQVLDKNDMVLIDTGCRLHSYHSDITRTYVFGDASEQQRAVWETEKPDYAVPGLPHRTGHGIGLDIHEWPYLVRSEDTLLDVGMCFSNEPMLCLYGEFGVRLEDHFFMTADGPKWFTQPSHAIDDPFGYRQ
jgi:Xaa-Pro dipeptidase